VVPLCAEEGVRCCDEMLGLRRIFSEWPWHESLRNFIGRYQSEIYPVEQNLSKQRLQSTPDDVVRSGEDLNAENHIFALPRATVDSVDASTRCTLITFST
jgi:hypothetical protein